MYCEGTEHNHRSSLNPLELCLRALTELTTDERRMVWDCVLCRTTQGRRLRTGVHALWLG